MRQVPGAQEEFLEYLKNQTEKSQVDQMEDAVPMDDD